MDVAYLQNRPRTDVSVPVHTPSPTDAANRRELIKAVRAINQEKLYGTDRELTYSIDRNTKRVVTKLVDTITGDVLDQIPSEYVLRLAEEYKQNP